MERTKKDNLSKTWEFLILLTFITKHSFKRFTGEAYKFSAPYHIFILYVTTVLQGKLLNEQCGILTFL